MPNPTRQQIHIDRALTNISVAWMQQASAFIADRVFPIVPVQKQSDRYFQYLREDWYRDEAKKRAPATESAGGEYEIDNTPTYFCEKIAFHKEVTEEERVNADSPLAPDRDATEFVTTKLLLRREVDFVQTYFQPGVWGTELDGVAGAPGPGEFRRWDDPASTPIQDITTAQMAILSATGYKPMTLVLGANVYAALRNHEDILGRIVFTQRGVVTPDILAHLFDVNEVLISSAVRNIAAKGAAEDTDFIAGDHAMLTYRPQRAGLRTPSAGYIFAWTGLMGAGAYGNRIQRLPMPLLGLGTERIEGEMAYDMRRVAAELGYFFNQAVS